MRPSRIIALVDAGAIGVATALFIGPSLLGVAYVAVALVVMWASGAYRPRIYYRLSTHLPTLLGQMTVSTLIVSAWPSPHRLTFLVHLPLTVGVIVAARLTTYAVLRATRSQPGPDVAPIIGADGPWAIPFRQVRRPGHHGAARRVKRVADVALAATMVGLTGPILAIVALAVRLTSQGPIFFRQKRIGQDGREFELLKFRTMLVNDDSDTIWSVHDDRRMTSVGRFLRRSCVDELPQLFNVIRGDMSLVGPRPERPYFDLRFRSTVPDYADRLRVPVGITGWAQIHGLRGDTSITDRTRFDNFYIDHWSPLLDVVIMVRTLAALVQWVFITDAVAAGSAEALPEPVMIGQGPAPTPLAAAGNPQ